MRRTALLALVAATCVLACLAVSLEVSLYMRVYAPEGALCDGGYHRELQGFLSPEDCDDLIRAASREKMVTSEVSAPKAVDLDVRKSKQVWFPPGKHRVTDLLRERTRAFLKGLGGCVPDRYSFEHVQVVRYDAGGKYEPHRDGDDCGRGVACPGDQRICTMLVYLSEPEAGGGTSFPLLDKTVRAQKGKALFFWVACPKTRYLFEKTLHGGDVVKGNKPKWIATVWVRARPSDWDDSDDEA